MIDLTVIPDDYLPRTSYIPACEDEEYQNRVPKVSWVKNKEEQITSYFRLYCRRQLSQSGERTFISSIVPKNIAHIHPVLSLTFAKDKILIDFASLSSSLVFDFYIKTTGKSDLYGSTLALLPLPSLPLEIKIRTLSLTCLTTHYAELWESCYVHNYNQDQWTKSDDPRLNQQFFAHLTPEWQRHNALRTDYERRQALVEIDVLAAIALGLTLDELITIYRVQFPVMRQYEKDTWYDMKGRIVFTNSKGLVGVGFPRNAKPKDGEPLGWEDIKDMKSGTVERTILDDTMPNGPIERTITYYAPFTRCDREEDYVIAWKAFTQRLGGEL